MDDAHAPEIMSGQMNVVKTYLKARYRLSDLLRAQRNDRMTSSLKDGSRMEHLTRETWKKTATKS